MQSLFTPGQFINAALCKALQVSEKILHVCLRPALYFITTYYTVNYCYPVLLCFCNCIVLFFISTFYKGVYKRCCNFYNWSSHEVRLPAGRWDRALSQ